MSVRKTATRMPRLRAVLVGAVAAMALVFAAAPVAQADLLSTFEASSSSTQAGAHADVRTNFVVTDLVGDPVKTVRFHLPTGLLGTIGEFAECSLTDFFQQGGFVCPPESQVGDGFAPINNGSAEFPFIIPLPVKVVVLKAGRGDTAVLGVWNPTPGRPVIRVSVRPGDYGLDATVESNPTIVAGADVTLWGVPWDHWDPATQASNKRLPFMANPSTCADEAVTTVEVDSYKNPGVWEKYSATSPAQTGCDQQRFEPDIWTSVDSPFTSSPSSFDFGIDVPQNDDPDGLATPPIRNVTAVLPEGVSINPAVANGLDSCTDAELGQGSNEKSSCPAASKIGTAEFEVPALKDPHVSGSVYVGQQLPDDTYRLFLEAYGSSLRVKLKGSVLPDPDTGRLTAVFKNNPEAQASSIKLSFRGGPRAALAMPDDCGAKTVSALIDSWSGHSVNATTAFDVSFDPSGSPCPARGFSPSFTAGSVNPVAGGNSPFAMQAHKPDGQSDLNGITLSMPEGLLASLRGSLGTRIGTARAAAGTGSSPFWLSGPVVLEGPYGDAPFSLRVTVPAVAGPFDLGDVVVRQKIYVDPNDARATVVSDPFPTIVKGIPVRLQNIGVDIDKPGFMRNPTSCAPKTINATLYAATGQTAGGQSRYQVGECAALGFTPKLALGLTGRKQVRTGQHPGVRAKVTQKMGQAGIGKAVVALPKSLALDPDNAQALCEYVDGTKPDLENHCPKGSIVGKARARTPLLDRELTGNVYFVKNVRRDAKTGNTIRTLPMIVVALRGEIAINLRGESSTTKSGQLVNTFAKVPDAPVSSFNLDIKGGNTGILAVTRTRRAKINLCTSPNSHTADVDLNGHNGKTAGFATTVKTPCKGAKAANKAKKAKRNKK